MNVGSLLTGAAQSVPEHIAIIYGNLRRSYREVNARANSLASALRRGGLARGDGSQSCSAMDPNFWNRYSESSRPA
jgi:non-ribosomal peptide synthetase component E (peptide arylation enzyme)